MPNNLEEKYKVLDRGFFSDGSGGEYQAKVKRLTDLPNQSNKIVYNIHGDNSRININSSDNSINVVDRSSEEFFTDLKSIVKKDIPEPEREHLLEKINELENSVGKKSYSQKYAEFMALAANHATVLTPYFPALWQFLSQSAG